MGIGFFEAAAGEHQRVDVWGNWWFVAGFAGLCLGLLALAWGVILFVREHKGGPSGQRDTDWIAHPYGTQREEHSEESEAGETTEFLETKRGRSATVRPNTLEAKADIPTLAIHVSPPPVDPGPELPDRELTPEEEAFLFAPTDRPDEPLTAGLDRPPIDPGLSLALGRARKTATTIQALLEEAQLPPLDVLRDMQKLAIWRLQQEQATLGRYMNRLHGHVLVAVDGLRPYASHKELDRLYRNPRNTGDLRMIASLLDTVADIAMLGP